MGCEGGCFLGFFHRPEKNCQQKNFIPMNRIAMKETGHYCLVTMSVHTHTHCYPFFESAMKTAL